MFKLIQTTVANAEQADRLARLLIGERLAACVQAMPVTSTYRWEGNLEQNGEILLQVKTTAARRAALKQRLSEEHPYDVPEIVDLDIGDVAAPYAAWAREQTETAG